MPSRNWGRFTGRLHLVECSKWDGLGLAESLETKPLVALVGRVLRMSGSEVDCLWHGGCGCVVVSDEVEHVLLAWLAEC